MSSPFTADADLALGRQCVSADVYGRVTVGQTIGGWDRSLITGRPSPADNEPLRAITPIMAVVLYLAARSWDSGCRSFDSVHFKF